MLSGIMSSLSEPSNIYLFRLGYVSVPISSLINVRQVTLGYLIAELGFCIKLQPGPLGCDTLQPTVLPDSWIRSGASWFRW